MSGKLKLSCIQSIWGAGKSDENRPKCPAVSSLFPYLWVCITEEYVYASNVLLNNEVEMSSIYEHCWDYIIPYNIILYIIHTRLG